MSTGTTKSGGGLPIEVLAGFGYFPPSLLVPQFEVIIVDPLPATLSAGDQVLAAAPDRYALQVCNNSSFIASIFTGQPNGSRQPMWTIQVFSHITITFAEVGALISGPMWMMFGAATDITIADIRYKPQRCPPCA